MRLTLGQPRNVTEVEGNSKRVYKKKKTCRVRGIVEMQVRVRVELKSPTVRMNRLDGQHRVLGETDPSERWPSETCGTASMGVSAGEARSARSPLSVTTDSGEEGSGL